MATKEDSRIVDQQMGFINNKLFSLEEIINEKATVNVVEMPVDLQEKIKNMEDEIRKLTNNNNLVANKERVQNKNKKNKRIIINKALPENIVAASDVILLTTSNGKNIDTDILNNRYSTQNFTCYTYKEVVELCNKVKIENQPVEQMKSMKTQI